VAPKSSSGPKKKAARANQPEEGDRRIVKQEHPGKEEVRFLRGKKDRFRGKRNGKGPWLEERAEAGADEVTNFGENFLAKNL